MSSESEQDKKNDVASATVSSVGKSREKSQNSCSCLGVIHTADKRDLYDSQLILAPLFVKSLVFLLISLIPLHTMR